MALPGFRNHPKFRRLVATLRIPEAHVLGHVEMLWEVCYESGNAVLGDDVDVELAAGWTGEPGALCQALASCGGRTRDGLIEETEPGVWQVHDLLDHAPDYVDGRRKRSEERGKDKVCEQCETVFRSSDPRARYCSHICRKAAWKTKNKPGTDGDGSERIGTEASVPGTDGDGSERPGTEKRRMETPLPGQPSPAQARPVVPPTGGAGGGILEAEAPDVPLKVPRRPRDPKPPPAPPGMYPPQVVDAVNQIATLTPKLDPQERPIKVDAAKLADRIHGLFQGHPTLTVEVLVQSWVDYLSTKPAWIKAPHYFFGRKEDQKAGAHWHEYAAMIWHRQAKAQVPA